ncbi:hypothetical protein [Ensifer sp. LC163]|uniref:hypothetical protein n=1 Tax=Ensifer sp. LC163 TaxID=1120652 RepID=UPI0009F4B321|nr:hypothetical protein [Ensifer sp. LC163]
MAKRGRKAKSSPISLPTIGSAQAHAELKQVDNPLHNAAHDGETWNPKKILVAVNVKESALVVLEQRRLINDAQVKAGEKFRRIWEALGGSGAGSFDYSREPVDGGGPRSALSDSQIQAGIDLADCRRILGIGYDVMVKIAGEGRPISDMTQSKNLQRAYIEILKQGLTALAVHFGYENTGKLRRTA